MIDVINENNLLEMAVVTGKYSPDNIDFSFYLSQQNSSHGIRVKICWNRERMRTREPDGYMELHGNYDYVRSEDGKRVSSKEIEKARQYFKKYKVLFSAVWELDGIDDVVHRYLEGIASLKDILDFMEIDENISSVEDLEKYVRENNLFNMND